MTGKTASVALPAGPDLDAAYQRSVIALDTVEELLCAHLGGRELSEDESLSVSSCLAEALRGLHSLQPAAGPGIELAQHTRDGLRRFDKLLREIAEAELLPER